MSHIRLSWLLTLPLWIKVIDFRYGNMQEEVWTKTKKRSVIRQISFGGRSDETRTRGLMDPNHARYQTALHPDDYNIIYYTEPSWICQEGSGIFLIFV